MLCGLCLISTLRVWWGAQVLSYFNFMQQFRFQYQLEGKGIENNFGPSVKLSDKKIKNDRQNPRWLPISTFLSHYDS